MKILAYSYIAYLEDKNRLERKFLNQSQLK